MANIFEWQYLLAPSVATLSMIAVSTARKQKLSPWRYVIAFLIILVAQFVLFSGKAHAQNVQKYDEFAIDFDQFDQEAISQQDRIKLQYKVAFHRQQGKRCFEDAESKCTLIPDWNDRQLAENLFTSCVTAICTGSLQSAAIASLCILGKDYCLHIYDVWKEINTLLNESKYHWDMVEFYSGLLAKA